MILVRNSFQVKFGRMKEAVALMKENLARARAAGVNSGRLLTDLTGPFYTLVLELEYKDLAAADKEQGDAMKLPGWRESYEKFAAVVDSGRREIFSIVP
jgi:hypothetical protein